MGRDVNRSLAAAALLRCEINAPDRTIGSNWRRIVATCAADTRQTVATTVHTSRRAQSTGEVVLHLPAALAAAQHPVWCLACRLACFLPDARVSVLIHAEAPATAERGPALAEVA